MARELEHQSAVKDAPEMTIDTVTELYNAAAAKKEIEEYLSKNPQAKIAVYMMDIDNFTMVENSVGRLFGDEILKEIADILRQALRCYGVIGRVNDDKFIVYHQEYENQQQIEEKAKEICRRVRSVYVGENLDFNISVSIGIAFYPDVSGELETVLHSADKALEYVKEHGKDNYALYREEMKEQVAKGRVFGYKESLEEYEEENENMMHGFDTFGYELVDLAFNLMEDSDHIESAINLLLHKIGRYYDCGIVALREVVNKPRTLRYLYEYIKSKDIPLRCNLEWQYSEAEWDTFREHFKDGIYIYQKSRGIPYDIPSIESPEYLYQTFIEIPIYNNGRVCGCIDYAYFDKEREFTTLELNTLKMFAKIMSTYLVNAKNYQYTSRKIEELSDYDALTGLMRYEIFSRRLKQSAKAELKDSRILIIYSDLRNFKYINEAYGYDMGNKLLQRFCDKMTKDIKRLIGAARVYSDNVVMAADYPAYISDDEIFEKVCRKNEQMNKELQEMFMDNNISVCQGIFLIKDNRMDVEVAVSNANMARKKAKKTEKTNVVLFDNQMMESVVRQMQLNAELPEALRNNEIKVYYQPKIESGTGKIVGGEALVRWIKPDGTFVYPDQFIPGFEENGMIVEIDYFVYDAVFKKIRQRLDQNKPVVPVSMNISRVHLKENEFIGHIRGLFDKYEIPAEYVEFELTESIYIENLEPALSLIRSLRNMGIRVSMDDFGSGYSSLNTLNNLPIDILKLDKVFLNGDDLTVSQKIIISSIVEMASKLNIRVVCEGVETAEQVQFLTVIGCDMIQGYYYAKPMPEKEFGEYIDAHIKVKSSIVEFLFNGNLWDTSGRYLASYVPENAEEPEYVAGPFRESKALYLKGAPPVKGLVEIPANVYSNSSYTITCWAKVNSRHMWTSLVFMKFENGFNSIMPNAGDLRADFRIKHHAEKDVWNDTSSTVATDNAWHFYAATYNAQTKVGVFYIDYRIAGYIENVSILNNLRQILVGGDIYTKSFDGLVADFRLYNQPLSRTDIINVFHETEEKLTDEVRKELRKSERIYL